MSTIKILCPHCGFAKDMPAERVPLREVEVTCPKCKQGFPLSLGMQTNSASDVSPLPVVTSATETVQNSQAAAKQSTTPDSTHKPLSPESIQSPSITELSVHQGGSSSKALLLGFIVVIILLVGVRLWADGKKRSVPFPNFIATAAQGVAVSWGQEIYFLDHTGKVVRKQNLPPDVILTQLKFVGDELWIANHASKSIQRLRNNGLETVVNGADRFRGAFKFTVDLQAGQVFVSDASNHKVHVFSIDGKHLNSFGYEGKAPAELMFPNTILFDSRGDLLIANTNAHRLDVFTRDGEFVKSFAKVESMGAYRFPTLLAQVGDRVAFLLTVDLREAKVVMYGNDGLYVGEFIPPKPIQESGDVAAIDGKVLVTDNKERKVYQFSGDDLSYLGPFSAELDARGTEAAKQETRYANLANGALIALLVMCVPVLFLYLKIRRKEFKKIDLTDFSQFVSGKALWSCELNRSKMRVGMLLMVVSLLIFLGVNAVMSTHPFLALPLCMGNSVLVIAGWSYIFIESGYWNPARKKVLERLVKATCKKAVGILDSGERVEACTAVTLRPFKYHPALLLFTNRRLLICDLSVTRSGIRQLGYGDITALSLEPVRPSFRLLYRLLPVRYFGLCLKLEDGAGEATIQFSGSDCSLLDRIQQYLNDRRSEGEKLGCSVLCDSCFRPARSDACTCLPQSKKDDWKPLVLSLIYPGLGQLYNREFLRGAFNSVLFSAGVIMLTRPVIKMLDRSAEFTVYDVDIIAQNIAGLLFLYVVSGLDADQMARKGRKLFSEATGDALRDWLQKRVAVMAPFRKKLFVELVPGVAHAMAGNYLRAFLFFIPMVYLVWTTGWSLLLIVSAHAGSFDYLIFEFGSAITAIVWITMAIDGARQLDPKRLPIRITAKGCLITLGIPCITLTVGFFAQLLWEKTVGSDPALRKAMHSFFRQLYALAHSTGRSGYPSFGANLFLGWGGATMAMFSLISWQLKKNKADIVTSSIVGFLGGAVCWTVCTTVIGGIAGSFLLLPVLFGSVIGLFVFLYFRKTVASSLLVPAIMSAAVIGSVSLTFSSQLLMPVRPLLGDGATRIFMVALPAYFMHLAYLLMNKAIPVTEVSVSSSKDA